MGGVNKAEQRRELWRQRIAQQESGGQSIRAYCRERGLKEHDFYGWRPTAAETEHPCPLRAGGDQAGRTDSCTHRTDVGERRPAADSSRCRDAQVGTGGAAGTGVMHLPASGRVYWNTFGVDMSQSFAGVHALVTQSIQLDAFPGHRFVFANRRKVIG